MCVDGRCSWPDGREPGVKVLSPPCHGHLAVSHAAAVTTRAMSAA
jgi:hypothetical protein